MTKETDLQKIEKLSQATGYILRKYGSRLNYTKLIKLLYLADKESFSEINRSVTGDSYASMKNGPVLSQLYDLIKGTSHNAAAQNLWNTRFSTDGRDLTANFDRIPEGKLSRFEKTTLDKIDQKFHNQSYGEMIDYVHDPAICPEWKDPGNTSIPIPIEDILESVGRTPEEIAWIVQDTNVFEQEEKLFRALAE
jgi:uncharacterized phage-associated protein